MDSETNKILVVDDNAITARWVGYVTGRLGFNVALASNGEEALNRLAEEQFVTVISDVEMPEMNGFELLQNIRLFYPDMPVILMSSSWDQERRETARMRGAQAMLQKPVNTDQLTELFGGRKATQRDVPVPHVPVLSVSR
jgi:chemosensory pili system protein ChpA (sensor histidine kinase/response regulator)